MTTQLFCSDADFLFNIEIEQKQGIIGNILAWCHSHMEHEWAYEILSNATLVDKGKYKFFFKYKDDYVMFTLLWK